MTPDELRDLQAPLKARHRSDPATAMVTLRAAGALDAQDVVCSVATGRALVAAGAGRQAAGADRALVRRLPDARPRDPGGRRYQLTG